MNKLVHQLCTSVLFAFSLAFPAIAVATSLMIQD
jgi:hypothetical protein